MDPYINKNKLQLHRASPCINGGDPSGNYSDQTDLNNNHRVRYGVVDMGAYEVFPIAGDFNEPDVPDEDVDLMDYSVFADAISNTCDENNDWCDQKDIDQSGIVNMTGLNYFCWHWLYGVD